MSNIPVTYQEISDYVRAKPNFNLFSLRKQTFLEIENITKNNLICYVSKTTNTQQNPLISINDDEIDKIVSFFMDYGFHKSHGRSIDRNIAKEKGLVIINSEEISNLDSLLLSLFNQYHLFFAQSPFYKLFENSRGVNWGRANQIQLPLSTIPNQQLMPLKL